MFGAQPVGIWQARRSPLGPAGGQSLALQSGDRRLTFQEVIEGWRSDAGFRGGFLAELRRTPFSAFFWEMPPLDDGARGRSFECVVLNGPALKRPRPDPSAFRTPFAAASGSIAVFENLSGDATLVAPRPLTDEAGYGHLAAFLNFAPDNQQHDLLAALGEAIGARLKASDAPLWVSTAGLGVPWLHVQLDSTPKYYRHAPYRTA